MASKSEDLSLRAHNMVKKSAILYHYPCPDGAFAALAAHLYFSATCLPFLFFPNTVYNPIRPHQLPLDEISDLYLVDFVGPSGFIESISSKVDRVIVLDHHKTAMEMFSGNCLSGCSNVSKVIDMERSGATIAFDYFKEKVLSLENNPKQDQFISEFDRVRPLFDYIEDGDLGRWRLSKSKAFSSGLKDLNLEFNVLLNQSLFQQLLFLDLESVISGGAVSLAAKQKLIDNTLDQSYEIALGGGAFGNCLAVNADSVSELRTELGNQLATKSHDLKLRIKEEVFHCCEALYELLNEHVQLNSAEMSLNSKLAIWILIRHSEPSWGNRSCCV